MVTEKTEETLKERFHKNPQSIAQWLLNMASGKVIPEEIAQLASDALNVTVGDFVVNASNASTIVAKGITDFVRDNPLLHSVLMSTTPAYPAIYNMARIKMAATKLASGRGETLNAKEVAGIVGQTFANALFSGTPALQTMLQSPVLVPGAVDFGQHVGQQAEHLASDAKKYLDVADKTLTAVKDIYKQLQTFLDYLDKDIWPAVEMMRDLVVNPYLAAVQDASGTMDDLIRHYKDEGQSVDSAVPKIVGPNLDARKMQQIATALNLPVIGSMYAGQLNVLLMQRYQALHQRGFADDYAMLQAAMGSPGPSLFAPVQQMMGSARPPAWFMSK